MKLSTIRSRLSIVLLVVLILSLIAGCSNSDTSNSPEPTVTPGAKPSTESVSPAAEEETVNSPFSKLCDPGTETLSFWLPIQGSGLTAVSNANDTPVVQYVEKQTGVHIDFYHPTYTNIPEQYNLVMASGDYPDIIHQDRYLSLYPGGNDKAVNDGVYQRLNEAVDKWAPNYKAVLNSWDQYKLESVTDSGNIWAFYKIYQKEKPPFLGMFYRQDIFQNLGIDAPITIDGWVDVFEKLKTEGYDHFLGLQDGGNDTWTFSWMSAFDTCSTFMNVNGTIKYGVFEDGFKDYLALLHQFNESDYLVDGWESNDYLKNRELQLNDKQLIGITSDAGVGESMTAQAQTPSFYLSATEAPKKVEGQQLHLRHMLSYLSAPTVITSACENIEIAIKWMDNWYSEEGQMLANYGIEGLTYNMVNDKPVFTDYIMKSDTGLGFVDAWHIFCLPIFTVEFMSTQFDAYPSKAEADYVWGKDGADWVVPPAITYTDEEGQRYSSIMSDINTYVAENIVRFASGDKSLESDYDAFIEQIKSMGIDEATTINQAALDRYFNRMSLN